MSSPFRSSAPDDATRGRAEASRRAGTAVRTLEPLYSLADFCYGVRREVIEAIGLADEGYGLGPCWEMDYNIRAARPAGAAYGLVELMFIAPRLLPAVNAMRPGFLNPASIAIRRNSVAPVCVAKNPTTASTAAGIPARISRLRIYSSFPFDYTRWDPACPAGTSQPSNVQIASEKPLVSCIMPTCERLFCTGGNPLFPEAGLSQSGARHCGRRRPAGWARAAQRSPPPADSASTKEECGRQTKHGLCVGARGVYRPLG